MKLRILSIGSKPPDWVVAGMREYLKRLPRDFPVELDEIDAPKHGKDSSRHRSAEGERILGRVGERDWVVALDETGRATTSAELAAKLADWRFEGRDICFVIGGADGLDDSVRQRANETISLSKLTFPHYLVRVILAEALYRAWSIHAGHPYHRA